MLKSLASAGLCSNAALPRTGCVSWGLRHLLSSVGVGWGLAVVPPSQVCWKAQRGEGSMECA